MKSIRSAISPMFSPGSSTVIPIAISTRYCRGPTESKTSEPWPENIAYVPARGAIRSLVTDALAPAAGRGADRRAAAGEPLGGAPERGDRDQRSRTGRGGHHRAGESDRQSDRRPA